MVCASSLPTEDDDDSDSDPVVPDEDEDENEEVSLSGVSDPESSAALFQAVAPYVTSRSTTERWLASSAAARGEVRSLATWSSPKSPPPPLLLLLPGSLSLSLSLSAQVTQAAHCL